MVRVMRKLSLLYFPLFTLLLVTGREFIVTLFTPRFVESWPIFFVNLALLPLAVLINDPVLRAYPEHRNFLLKLRVALLAVLVVALQIGIAQLGMLGAIVVVVGILTAERAIITLRVMSILRIRAIELRPLKDLIGIAAAAAVAAIVAAGARTVVMDQGALAVLLICAPMHLLAYVAGLLLLKVPNAEEMDVAHRHWARVRRRLSFGAQPSRTTVS
jgi:O-antigen/teichoic acid export membrane protein